ncbi:MAG: NAD(P)H-dependent oxidoreductase [Chlorobiales bacterium]|nr:NAD(P)H-dependent oxidoreductase [Chlorobiales bacterium]
MSSTPCHILAVVGTYRKGGIIDTAVDEILSSAKGNGAETRKIYLIDTVLSFCTNCRSCTQQEGQQYGACMLDDDMKSVLQELEWADSIVLASPMNAGTVTAVMKVFIERLVCTAYWPWGSPAPKNRNPQKKKRAVLVASSAAPALMARFMEGDILGRLKSAASMLGACTIGTLFIGLAAQHPHQGIGKRAIKKARLLGQKLAERRVN